MPKTVVGKGVKEMRSVYKPLVINRKAYQFHSWYNNKRSAQAEAERVRKAGHLARVKAHNTSFGKYYGVYVYS